ncbi:sorting nexin-8 [Manduca sexta]|uniref:PX domain-containing protein n=1 Tax=Manduca sexta TaxID=7130 RepID=A0A921ZV03_MANSE|nr:sorting nexin-8 [Manduca sexta]XP_030037371.1 sorting nexin-8 [Manduca sexta]XP_030037372.1 sorting nexin-8 [Manduca sexta]KAG6464200.1 hypothetical protein O3G_MSEX014346 [Manduca sexta]
MTNMDIESVTFEGLEATDVITVELVPERKGLILKHCEYYVSSRRYGTTVTRRYNEFAQLYEILYAKYPYRAICRLPPKRVVVGGGSPHFLQRRRIALQRWLTLMARHPVLGHDADLRMFLCEIAPKLDKPKHDEFVLAGTQEIDSDNLTPEDMQAKFIAEQEQLRLVQLGLSRMSQIFQKVENRYEVEMNDIRELGAALQALSAPAAAAGDTPRWARVKLALATAAQLALKSDCSGEQDLSTEAGEAEEAKERVALALEALAGGRELYARLTRGLHAERAAAGAAATGPAAQLLRARHKYALRCALQEASVGRAYALSALEALGAEARAAASAHARAARHWSELHAALR